MPAMRTYRALDPDKVIDTIRVLHQRISERFPGAAAEDMEGFGVALACALHGVPLSIVRGISNAAGQRAPAHWRISPALAAARTLLLELLESSSAA